MSSVQATQNNDLTSEISIPSDMTREEVVQACERTVQRDNAMSDVADELLNIL